MRYPASSSGKWRLMEARIDMNSIPTVFNFQMSTGATVFLDDVSFYPENAEYVRSTYDPLSEIHPLLTPLTSIRLPIMIPLKKNSISVIPISI
ncbi:MAG: hypothetical protein IPJ20_23495 [Flammeovirgaceae bacterium]|nr:hypothetical protein [Flammeovirgaceae bacterium]